MKTRDQLEQELYDAQAMAEFREREFSAAKAAVLSMQRGGDATPGALHRMIQASADLSDARALTTELEHTIWLRER